jgi:hypothetical protein
MTAQLDENEINGEKARIGQCIASRGGEAAQAPGTDAF